MSIATADSHLREQVRAAIERASQQTIRGTIEYHVAGVYPPQPGLLADVDKFDPANAPVSSNDEANAKMRETYRRIQEQMREHSLYPHTGQARAAVTTGPADSIRLDRLYEQQRQRSTTWREGRMWEYETGRATLLTCDGLASDPSAPGPAGVMHIDVNEARYVVRLFVNQLMTPELAQTLASVRRTSDGTIVGEARTSGELTKVGFFYHADKLLPARIIRESDGNVHSTSFRGYFSVGNAWIPQRIEYMRTPTGRATGEDILREAYRLERVTHLDAVALQSLFAPPDPFEPANEGLLYVQDVTQGDQPMRSLRDDGEFVNED